MLLNSGVGEDSWESLRLQGNPTSPSSRSSVLGVHWKDWCWSWNSNTLATWCEELTHLKRPWCWEKLKAGKEGDDRRWDGGMASPTQWTWVWVNSKVDNGQGVLVCCSPWGGKELDTTERLKWTDGTRSHDLSFWRLSFKTTFSLSSFTFIKRLFSSSSLSATKLVSSVYLRLLLFFPTILISACDSSSLTFPIMYSA